MQPLKDFIASGILEMYVLGNASATEAKEIERMAVMHPEIGDEIESIERALQEYSVSNPVMPEETIKPFLLATIDYSERIKNGEAESFPPVINENSTIAEFNAWLSREDMQAPEVLPDLHARIIGYTPTMTTAIVWIKKMAPQEIHHDEFEKFLVVEGSCDIVISDETHQLTAGDTLNIPLYKPHVVTVTSAIPCKVILQRIAA
ncbi:cupin domain-containing protein [Ferruginibacter sp. SUN106]|uniref:cupin domain-containing protein n=1 Tax=Ferruginibacter sp. SUN106 TaxID=2978348 RepID=UPI003D36F907